MSRRVCILLSIYVCLSVVDCYPYFRDQIPNGHRVPSPCDVSEVWEGVGHTNQAGGGGRNPFGVDFNSNGRNWTRVCPLDSDGDGQTNGQELGDPNCSWTPGSPSPSSDRLSHPGVCEPIASTDCTSKNWWLACSIPFVCPAIQQPGVLSIPLRFPVTAVPAQETTYICQGFYLPNDTDYHVIASTPIVNNTHVMHHMLLFGCKDVPPDLYETSSWCPMEVHCLSIIAAWTYGHDGSCLPDEYGFRIGGHGGLKYAILQMHWNNPQLVADFEDSSGMMIYYTPNLRPNDGEVLAVGQMKLDIPPGQPAVTFDGHCSSHCSSLLPKSIYLTGVGFHMHLIGSAASLELHRGGRLIRNVISATGIDYNEPEIHVLSPEVEMQSGDELKVRCIFDSTSRNVTTRYGPATSDEMCFVFIDYYPAMPRFTFCRQWGEHNGCSIVNAGCNFTNNEVLEELYPNCNFATLKPLWDVWSKNCETSCSSECRETLAHINNTGCMTTGVAEYLFRCSSRLQVMVKQCAEADAADANQSEQPSALVKRTPRQQPARPRKTTRKAKQRRKKRSRRKGRKAARSTKRRRKT